MTLSDKQSPPLGNKNSQKYEKRKTIWKTPRMRIKQEDYKIELTNHNNQNRLFD